MMKETSIRPTLVGEMTNAESSVSPDAEIDRLTKQINESLDTVTDVEVQIQLSRIVNVLPRLRDTENKHLIYNANIAASALLKGKRNLPFAVNVINGIFLRASNGFRTRALMSLSIGLYDTSRNASAAGLVLFGLGLLAYFFLPLSLVFTDKFTLSGETLGIPNQLITIVAVSGAVGSIVSIMVRIRDFSLTKRTSKSILIMTGAFKPLIGTSFALFVFSAIKSKILPIDVSPELEVYFYIVVSFIAGFSERFAKDVASQVEGQIGGKKGTTK